MWYLDTSAFLKLVVSEDESAALRRWLREHGTLWSSQLLVTESFRAAERLGLPAVSMDQALDTVNLVLPSVTTFRRAGHLAGPALRSLDALHLATALEMQDELEGMVTYDMRMVQAARTVGIATTSPG